MGAGEGRGGRAPAGAHPPLHPAAARRWRTAAPPPGCSCGGLESAWCRRCGPGPGGGILAALCCLERGLVAGSTGHRSSPAAVSYNLPSLPCEKEDGVAGLLEAYQAGDVGVKGAARGVGRWGRADGRGSSQARHDGQAMRGSGCCRGHADAARAACRRARCPNVRRPPAAARPPT